MGEERYKVQYKLTYEATGGGFGYARNITFRNFEMHNVEQAWHITQCTSYNGVEGGCDTSRFKISDMHWGAARGTVRNERVATLDCSGEAPCERIELFDNDLTLVGDAEGRKADVYLCDYVEGEIGFACTEPCNGRCPR